MELINSSSGRQSVLVSTSISTNHSSLNVENMTCDFGDLLTFSRRLHRLLEDQKEKMAALRTLRPMLDLAIVRDALDTKRIRLCIAQSLRAERHTFEFELSLEEAAAFAHSFQCALVSLPTEGALATEQPT